jgi:outer membrane protein
LSDTLQAETALARASLERSRAEGARDRSLAALGYSLGLGSGHELVLSVDATERPGTIEQDLDRWLADAQRAHPALVAARAQVIAAREKASATRAEGLPSIDFMASYFQNGRPNQGLTAVKTEESIVGLTLTVPLFDGFGRTYRVRGAEAQIEQRLADRQDAERQVSVEIVRAFSDARAAAGNWEAAERWLRAAERSFETVQRRFDAGAGDIVERLSAQNALSEARLERARALADWRSARLRLLANAGRLNREALAR